MPELDAQSLAEQVVLLGLVTKDQIREAKLEAEDGSVEALERVLFRKGLLTSWQLEKLHKGEIGFFYGGCKVLFHIAEGTFARVYRGLKMPGQQPVAIKVLRQRFTTDPGAIERFKHEAEAGQKLIHPNIVRIYDYGEDDKKYFMIMEYVEGSNLRDFMKLRTRLTHIEAMPLMLGLARGLQYAISHGVTHRDIKGTNILISNAGEAKLVDFGLAQIENEDKRATGGKSDRTVDYSALERTSNSPKGDIRSDIFFLGCVFYQMLTGVLPLPETESKDPIAKMLKRSFGAIKPIAEHRLAPPPELCEVIDRMMKIDLRARYQTMDEVVRDLEWYDTRSGQFGSGRSMFASQAAAATVIVEPDDFFYDEVPTGLEPAPAPGEVKAINARQVLCVEVQPETQNALRKSLGKMGYRVLLVANPDLAAERYREAPTDLVLFDADGLEEDAFDAFIDMHNKAHEDGHPLTALVLLGPRQRALANKLPSDDRLVVLSKPIKMKQIQDALRELIPPLPT